MMLMGLLVDHQTPCSLGRKQGGLNLMVHELSDPFSWETFKELTVTRQNCFLIIIFPVE